MASYKYSAISLNGERVNGVVEAYNEFDAADRIKQNCRVVLKLAEVKEEKKNILLADLDADKLDKKAFTLMCNQFSVILKAGVPIGRTVRLICDKTENKNLHRVLSKVAEDVVAGRSLATSFAERGGKLFPITFIETVRAGEESGTLADSFDAISRYYSKRVKMASKVRGALIYPTFVLIVAIVVVIVLMVKVVPTFIQIFDSMNMELPVLTRALIAVSHFFQKYTLLMVAIAALVVIGIRLYAKNSEGRLKLAKLQLQIPVLGKVAWLDAASQFANTMAMMLAAGLPITKAVSISAKTIENYYISYEIGTLTVKLEEGRSLYSGLQESGVLPDILVDMVGVGEETGELEKTLGTIGVYYDDELEQATSEAVAKLEPAVLVVLAGIAGFIVIAMYTAMFSMYSGM